jgi:hypothetical protein
VREVFLAASLLLTALFYTYMSPPTSILCGWPREDLRDHQVTGLPNECGVCHSIYE